MVEIFLALILVSIMVMCVIGIISVARDNERDLDGNLFELILTRRPMDRVFLEEKGKQIILSGTLVTNNFDKLRTEIKDLQEMKKQRDLVATYFFKNKNKLFSYKKFIFDIDELNVNYVAKKNFRRFVCKYEIKTENYKEEM